MTQVAICSIVKKEAPYLREWISFHHLQGVSTFHLYHNADVSEDSETSEVIGQLSEHFNIHYFRWPGKSTMEHSIQLAAYDDCLSKQAEADWVACIDCDEFLYSPTKESIPEVLDKYPHYTGAVLVHWMFYGSNGHLHHSPEMVIERFTKSAKQLDSHVKTIIRPDAYKSTGKNVHRLITKPGYETNTTTQCFINHDQPWVHRDRPELRQGSYLTLAHFHTKSKEEYRGRCARGRADFPIPKNFEENFIAHDLNEREDTYIRDTWAHKIKELI